MTSAALDHREQEPIPPLHAQKEFDEAMPRRGNSQMNVNVALADRLYEQGKAREAFTLYKETIKQATEAPEILARPPHRPIQSDGKTVAELLHTDFTPDEKRRVIDELLMTAGEKLERAQYDRAVETFEKVFLLDPLNARASRGIDRARKELIRQTRQTQEAVLEQYSDESREKIQTELNRAWFFIKQGSSWRARAHLERVLLIDPDHPEARRLLRELDR